MASTSKLKSVILAILLAFFFTNSYSQEGSAFVYSDDVLILSLDVLSIDSCLFVLQYNAHNFNDTMSVILPPYHLYKAPKGYGFGENCFVLSNSWVLRTLPMPTIEFEEGEMLKVRYIAPGESISQRDTFKLNNFTGNALTFGLQYALFDNNSIRNILSIDEANSHEHNEYSLFRINHELFFANDVYVSFAQINIQPFLETKNSVWKIE